MHHLDCRGLKCPMPIVRISTLARGLTHGDELKVEADDPAFRADVHAWARRSNFEVRSFEVNGTGQVVTLVKR